MHPGAPLPVVPSSPGFPLNLQLLWQRPSLCSDAQSVLWLSAVFWLPRAQWKGRWLPGKSKIIVAFTCAARSAEGHIPLYSSCFLSLSDAFKSFLKGILSSMYN